MESFLKAKKLRVLICAEKNSVAKHIYNAFAKFLLVRKKYKTKGKSRYNPIYHLSVGDGNQILITSASGFLFGLDLKPPFSKKNKWKLEGGSGEKKWTLDDLIHAETEWKISGTGIYLKSNELIIAQIKELAHTSDYFVSATDNDFAGELIGYQILQVAQEVNPEIKPLRMIFSSVAYSDLIESWKKLKEMRKSHRDAELTRQRSDLMTGALFTRLLTLLIKEKVPGVMLSWGGCQTLFLKYIVDKNKAHNEFEPEQFWEVVATIKQDSKEYVAKWEEGRKFKRKEAKRCLLDASFSEVAKVVKINRSEWKSYPPIPLRTATLLTKLTKIMGTSANTIMGVAEALYNKGFISYPRTENEVHPFSFNANHILTQFETHPIYGDYTKNLLASHGGKRIYPRKGRTKTEEHDPIHPTKSASQSQVESAVNKKHKIYAWKVYDFISRHFIATCSQLALFHKTEIKLNLQDRIFALSGKIKISDGYLEIYPFYQPKIKEVPNCEEGDLLTVEKVEMTDGWTKPPPLPEEADVIKWASDNNIGTDATFHTHLETVQKRNYVEKQSKKLLPTKLGKSLCDVLESNAPAMLDTKLRRELQENMDLISEGKADPEHVLDGFRDFARLSYKQLMKKKDAISENLSSVLLEGYKSGQDLGICGKCGASMHLETKYKYGGKVSRYATCEGCDTTLVLPKEGKIRPLPDKTCVKCGFTVLKIKRYVICPYCFTQEKEKGLFYCNKCREKDCEFSDSGIGEIDLEGATIEPIGRCPKCDDVLEAILTTGKRFVKCKNDECDFRVNLPRPSKGKVEISDKKCPECNTLLFSYYKKKKTGYSTRELPFCVGCKEGEMNFCYYCSKKCF